MSTGVVGKAGRLIAIVIGGLVKGAIAGMYSAVGDDGIEMLINNNWHVLPIALTTLVKGKVEYPEGLSEEQIAYMENFRSKFGPAIVSAMKMAKQIGKAYPNDRIEKELDKEWIKRRLREVDPKILEAIEKRGEEGERWLEEEARLLREFLTS